MTDHVNSITRTVTDPDEDHDNTTDTDGEKIGEHQTDSGDMLEANHQDAYVERSSQPDSLDHDSGTSDVDYGDE